MKLYILTDDPYHENEMIHGVFSSLEAAQAAHKTCRISAVIYVVELDRLTERSQKYNAACSHIPINTEDAGVIEL